MFSKTSHHNIVIRKQECRIANILKQEMLSVGGDAAVARGVVDCSINHSDVILMGTKKQILLVCKKLRLQPFGLPQLAQELEMMLANLEPRGSQWRIRDREIPLGSKTLIMGILNLTPDSFSDGGTFQGADIGIARAWALAEAGADIIDIGAESSRPGALPVSVEEEWGRLNPVLTKLGKQTELSISIDTTKAEIARRALDCGARIVNDISAMRFDAGMAKVVADNQAGLVLMHMKGHPRLMQEVEIHYDDIMGEIGEFLWERVSFAIGEGVAKSSIVIDPGIGFGKRWQDNLMILKKLRELNHLGLPLLVGASRKAFIGWLTAQEDPQKRILGSVAAHCLAVLNGARIIRAHDVLETREALAVIDAAAQL
ncbi:MAG: dihydropteroate synthase [Deltaproteobacteria bacterium]|nr:dihydropteroate synthase [Deltaproteobacteria bacterium]